SPFKKEPYTNRRTGSADIRASLQRKCAGAASSAVHRDVNVASVFEVDPVELGLHRQVPELTELACVQIGGGEVGGAPIVVQAARAVLAVFVPSLGDPQLYARPALGDQAGQADQARPQPRGHDPVRSGPLLVLEHDAGVVAGHQLGKRGARPADAPVAEPGGAGLRDVRDVLPGAQGLAAPLGERRAVGVEVGATERRERGGHPGGGETEGNVHELKTLRILPEAGRSTQKSRDLSWRWRAARARGGGAEMTEP